jgi:hypothetical protein
MKARYCQESASDLKAPLAQNMPATTEEYYETTTNRISGRI